MITYFSRQQTIAAVPGLSDTGLAMFLEAGLVVPTSSSLGPVFGQGDLARLALLCELADNFDFDGDGLAVVMGLIDQLHDTRRRLNAMAEAMEAEPQDLRHRIGERFVGILAVGRARA